ncbi:MAG: DUF1737 domain-containing protein [Proteobacteria bacterium]|nr:DUF1737 domain-containing protein [Pseudomonadota bacterium]MBU1059226.1 DUF1737 domain-containing protein [Pseudomonadota bacterium]
MTVLILCERIKLRLLTGWQLKGKVSKIQIKLNKGQK